MNSDEDRDALIKKWQSLTEICCEANPEFKDALNASLTAMESNLGVRKKIAHLENYHQAVANNVITGKPKLTPEQILEKIQKHHKAIGLLLKQLHNY